MMASSPPPPPPSTSTSTQSSTLILRSCNFYTLSITLLGSLLPGGIPEVHKIKQNNAKVEYDNLQAEMKKPKSFFGKLKKQTQNAASNLAFMTIDKTEPDDIQVILTESDGQLHYLTEVAKIAPKQLEDDTQPSTVFAVTLPIPPTPNNTITLKLRARSGGAKSSVLISSSKSSMARWHDLGNVTLNVNELHLFTSGTDEKAYTAIITGPGSEYLSESTARNGVNAKPSLKLFLISPKRIPEEMKLGWSLASADPSHLSSSPHHALSQTFCYTHKNKYTPIIATERTIISSLTLPTAISCSKLFSEAAAVSSAHSWVLSEAVRRRSCVFDNGAEALRNGHANVSATVASFTKLKHCFDADTNSNPMVCTVRVSLQPLGCVFAKELLTFEVKMCDEQGTSFSLLQPTTVDFYPKVEVNNHSEKNKFQLGSLKFEQTWHGGNHAEGVIGLDQYSQNSSPTDNWGTPRTIECEMFENNSTKRNVGKLNLTLTIEIDEKALATSTSTSTFTSTSTSTPPIAVDVIGTTPTPTPTPTSTIDLQPSNGLIELLGLTHLGSTPLDSPNTTENVVPKPSPLGDLLTPSWLDSHANDRAKDASSLSHFASINQETAHDSKTDPHKIRHPNNFKPSAAKSEPILSPLAINCHVHSFCVERINGQPVDSQKPPSKFFFNITTGAPCDHSRGFGKVPGTNASGGAKRLESKRHDLAKSAQEARLKLFRAVKNSQDNHPERSHIPASDSAVSNLRRTAIEREQQLATLTWACALRRANIFSQALSIALSSYLCSITDFTNGSTKFDHWKSHGFLINFEGMLSAAGQEKHMIEDACVGIEMLRNVRIRCVRGLENNNIRDLTNVPKNKNIIGLLLSKSEAGSGSMLMSVFFEEHSYDKAVPAPLQHDQAGVQIFPVLFEMGVDVRQWGANTGSNFGKTKSSGNAGKSAASVDDHFATPPLSDNNNNNNHDDEKEDGDLLARLNYTGFTQLNSYAHKVSPMGEIGVVNEGELPIHVLLGPLWQFVNGENKKTIEHDVLNLSGKIAANLGGAGCIFCKSGKDRTGMGVTFRQTQFLSEYVLNVDKESFIYKSNVMRIFGTRVAICDKNVGTGKFAFNALQVKFMPDFLKCPSVVCAGFMKDGKLFEGSGVES